MVDVLSKQYPTILTYAPVAVGIVVLIVPFDCPKYNGLPGSPASPSDNTNPLINIPSLATLVPNEYAKNPVASSDDS